MARLRGGGKRRGSGRWRRRRGRERPRRHVLAAAAAAADGEGAEERLGPRRRGGVRALASGAAADAGLPAGGGGGGRGVPLAPHRGAVARDDAGEDDPDLGEAVAPARDAGADEAAVALGQLAHLDLEPVPLVPLLLVVLTFLFVFVVGDVGRWVGRG